MKRHFTRSLVLTTLLAGLSACQLLPTSTTAQTPMASEVAVVTPTTESRQFRYLELDNGLKVLLVSDPSADKAAASLDVNVGSGADPEDYQGLAHFLEHMLFLGTEKYPQAGEYQAFITAHGGSHNAYTSFEHTNYFFDIAADSLAPALDRFAQFFIGPLFNAQYVKREVNAVDSEYQARIRSDGRRELSVFKSQLNPEHPFSKFSVGNLQTLQSHNEQALRQALLTFYATHYSANIMTLTVAGKESLSELEAMVRARFSKVVNRDIPREPITTPLFVAADDTSALPRWINIQPVQQQRTLAVQFPVPDADPFWQTKPMSYIGNLLGHEGQGSLLSELKARAWAENLSAGQSLDYRGGSVFGVNIGLTELGLKHADEIVALVYAQIALLKQAGVAQWRFDEQSGLAQQQFMFRAQPEPIHEVVQLSSALQDYPAAEVLRGPYRMSQFDNDALMRFLDAMRPQNSVVILSAPEVPVDRKVERYQVEYSLRTLPDALIKRWQQALLAPEKLDHQLGLPSPNAFIASDFSLKKATEPGVVKLSDDADVELWLHVDDQFELPKGRINLLLETPLAAVDAKSTALSTLWLMMVKDQLNELAYPAVLAGLSYDLSSSWRGVELSVSGYNEKQSVLLKEVLQVLRAPDWQPARFERLRAQQLRSYENRRSQSPYQQLMAELPVVLRRDKPELEALIAATRAATMPSVAAHVSRVLQDLQYRMLLDGNFDLAEAQSAAATVVSVMPAAAGEQAPSQQIVHLPRGSAVHALPMQHDDAGLVYYLQAPEAGKRWRVAMGLAAQMMGPVFYHNLRTEKQLGYIVSAGVYPQRDVGGMMFLVQSPVKDTAGLQVEINQWIDNWLAEGVSKSSFASQKLSLIKRLREKPSNLWEVADRHWSDLLDGETGFDSLEQLATALEQLECDEFRAMLGSAFAPAARRGVYLYGSGRWPEKHPQGTPLKNLADFKRALPSYVFD